MDIKKLLSKLDEKPVREILSCLVNSKYPISIDELARRFGVSPSKIDKILSVLENEGYDIKRVYSKETVYVSLVRCGVFDSSFYYKVLGSVSFPLLVTSDWHVGSTGFSKMAFQQLLNDCVKYNVKTLIHAGDLLQGLGVYRVEAMDIIEPSIDQQEKTAIDLLNQFPSSTQKILIIGNHEEKLKGSWAVGHDPLKAIASAVKNCKYYGHAAKLSIKNTPFNILVLHGAGAPSYARSYMSQKILRNLVERPTFLIVGHLHQLDIWNYSPRNFVISAGTLQRENSYLIQKGVQSVVGWIIIRNFDGTLLDAVIRIPKIF